MFSSFTYLFGRFDPDNLDPVVPEQLARLGGVGVVVAVPVAHIVEALPCGGVARREGVVRGRPVSGAKLDENQTCDEEDADEKHDEEGEDDSFQQGPAPPE